MNCLITKNNNTVSIQFDEFVEEAKIIIESKMNKEIRQSLKIFQTNFTQVKINKLLKGEKFGVEVIINGKTIEKKTLDH